MSKEQIDTKNCKECLHFEACCKWTDFPKQIGFPTCRNYRKQVEGEWITTEENPLHKITECTACKKEFYFAKKGQLNIDRMPFCPNCGSRMKGGAE